MVMISDRALSAACWPHYSAFQRQPFFSESSLDKIVRYDFVLTSEFAGLHDFGKGYHQRRVWGKLDLQTVYMSPTRVGSRQCPRL